MLKHGISNSSLFKSPEMFQIDQCAQIVNEVYLYGDKQAL